MSWSLITETMPIARKDYPCEGAEWIARAAYPDSEYDADDLAVIKQAKAEGNKILKGTKYIHIKGIFDGEWSVFRARIDLHNICEKYGCYPDD